MRHIECILIDGSQREAVLGTVIVEYLMRIVEAGESLIGNQQQIAPVDGRLAYLVDAIAGQTTFLHIKILEVIALLAVTVQSAPGGRKPQVAAAVLHHAVDVVVAEAILHSRVVRVIGERVGIEAIGVDTPAGGSHPQSAVTVETQACHHANLSPCFGFFEELPASARYRMEETNAVLCGNHQFILIRHNVAHNV